MNMDMKNKQVDWEFHILQKQKNNAFLQMDVLDDEHDYLTTSEIKRKDQHINQQQSITNNLFPKQLNQSLQQSPPISSSDTHFPHHRPPFHQSNNYNILLPPLQHGFQQERDFARERSPTPLNKSSPPPRTRIVSNIPVNIHGKRTETTNYRPLVNNNNNNTRQSSPSRYQQRNRNYKSPPRLNTKRFSPSRENITNNRNNTNKGIYLI